MVVGSGIYDLRFTIYDLRFTICDLRFAIAFGNLGIWEFGRLPWRRRLAVVRNGHVGFTIYDLRFAIAFGHWAV